MRRFWIKIRKEGAGVRIELGRGTENTGFMSRTWDNNRYDHWPPTHVAFSSFNSKVEFIFCLDELGRTSEPPPLNGTTVTGATESTPLNGTTVTGATESTPLDGTTVTGATEPPPLNGTTVTGATESTPLNGTTVTGATETTETTPVQGF